MKNLQVAGLKDVKEQLGKVLSMVREDFETIEAKNQEEELKHLIQQQMESAAEAELSKELKMVSELTAIGYCRDWLFSYKGRGYVMSDKGNQWMEYRCTVEDFLMSLGV